MTGCHNAKHPKIHIAQLGNYFRYGTLNSVSTGTVVTGEAHVILWQPFSQLVTAETVAIDQRSSEL